MLGFGGHFLTKARRYSVTFQLLRDTRVTYRRHEHEHQADEQPGTLRAVDHLDDDTTLIVGTLTFAGVGWHTTGDALLANTAAAMARANDEPPAAKNSPTNSAPPLPAPRRLPPDPRHARTRKANRWTPPLRSLLACCAWRKPPERSALVARSSTT